MEKMLEKNKFFDAHFHFSDCLEFQTDIDEVSLCGCTSCHNEKDFLMAELYKKNNPESLFIFHLVFIHRIRIKIFFHSLKIFFLKTKSMQLANVDLIILQRSTKLLLKTRKMFLNLSLN